MGAAGVNTYADRLGIHADDIVQEIGWDEDADSSISEAIEDAVGEQLLDDLAGVRPLDREHRVVVQAVVERHLEGLRLLAEPREVLLVVGGVGDGEVPVVTELVGEEVVEDAAAGIEAARRAGMRSVGVSMTAKLEADVAVTSLAELPPDTFDRLIGLT